jgi:hypothetical protein
MFTHSLTDTRSIAILKRIFVAIIVGLLVIGVVSSYRAYVQVRRLEIDTERDLTVGSNVGVSVVSSARGPVDVQLELIQASRSKLLFAMRVRGNEFGFFDPRSRSALQTFDITDDQLDGFQPGAAIIRATATGRPQWGRLPPPTVREVPVEIRR